MKVAVVILNWNKADLTRHCLDVSRRVVTVPLHWIVIDNGSTSPITGLPDDVTLVRNPTNLGFAGGVNVGLRTAFAAGADAVLLLNNDAEPLPGAVERLIDAAKDPGAGLLSPIILNSDRNDQPDWVASFWRDGVFEYTNDPARHATWLAKTPENICLTGTALLVTRALIEAAGPFDEALFAYWEDTDLSIRASAAGFRPRVVTEAAVRHACGTDELDAEARAPYYYYLMTRNELLLLRKNRVSWRAFHWMLRRAWRWWAKPGLGPRQRAAIRLGVLHGLLGRGGPPPARVLSASKA